MSIPKMAKAMGYIDDDLVSGAIEYKREKKKNTWVKWGAMAACLCLVVGLAIPVLKNNVFEQDYHSGLSNVEKTTMNNDLNSGLWIVGNVFTDDDNWSGHSIVIRSYNSTTQVYTFWDPWTNTIGTFTKTQLDNNTIHTVSTSTDRVLAWIQRCY